MKLRLLDLHGKTILEMEINADQVQDAGVVVFEGECHTFQRLDKGALIFRRVSVLTLLGKRETLQKQASL